MHVIQYLQMLLGKKSLVTGLKETETTLGGSIWTANDNREKKIYGCRSILFVKH